MSEESSKVLAEIDLTASPNSTGGKGEKTKKLKQMRLPFAPLNKVNKSEVKTDSPVPPPPPAASMKRKRSVDGETTPGKLLKEEEEEENVKKTDDNEVEEITVTVTAAADEGEHKKTPRRIKPTFVCVTNKKEECKAAKRILPTPVSSPSACADPSPDPAKKVKKMTPKTEAKRAEVQKKKDEKERERLEKERQKEEEKKKREEAKREKESLREAEKVEKERLRKQKEEERETEKKMKEEARLSDQQRKVEEKEKKAEEKKKQEEEKKKQEEEKRKHEEIEKLKQEKIAKSFTSFFIKKEVAPKPEEAVKKEENKGFNQFRVKKDMRVAPVVRRNPVNHAEFDDTLVTGDQLYIACLKNVSYKVGKSGKTWPVEETKKDDDVEIIEEDEEEEEAILDNDGQLVLETSQSAGTSQGRKIKAKLLQFCENRRPPFFGTWSKRSSWVGPRKPFAKDEKTFDYEYESDDDWEEEEQGESLSDEEKDKEDDEDPQDDDEEDDGFFVGHGVLDKDELHPEEEDKEDDEVGYDKDLEEVKQKLRAQEFEEQYKKRRPVKLKPRVFGCMWVDNNRNDIAYEQLIRILKPYSAVVLFPSGDAKDKYQIQTTISVPEASPTNLGTPNIKSSCMLTPSGGLAGDTSVASSGGKSKKLFPEESMVDLVNLIHCNTNNKMFLAKEFSEYLTKQGCDENQKSTKTDTSSTPTSGDPNIVSKRKILDKILEISEYKKFEEAGPLLNRKCWVVKKEILEKLDMTEKVQVPNSWAYILDRPNKTDLNKSVASVPLAASPATATPKRPIPEEEEKKKKRASIQTLFLNMKKKDENGQTQS